MPLIDGAETVSSVLNNSKIRFRKLLVTLITFGRKKYMLLRIYIGLCMSVTLKSPSRSIPDIPQVVFDFYTYLYIHTPRTAVLIRWDCQKSEINNSMALRVQKAHDVDSMSIRNLNSVEIFADIEEKYIYIYRSSFSPKRTTWRSTQFLISL
jgi:hypothetical protein